MADINSVTGNMGAAPDQDWVNSVQSRIGKVVQVVNNGSATYTVPAGVSFVRFSGTNVTTLGLTLPAAAVAVHGQKVCISSTAAISVSLTWTSTGATFIGAPATLAANTPVVLMYFSGTSTWEIVS